MKTIDDDVTAGTLGFLDRARKRTNRSFSGGTPLACTSGRICEKAAEGKTGLGIYADGMVEHDAHVGLILDKLEELGLDENTIVMYSTDNGAECFSWPDGGSTPFRNEKNSNWEGGYRVPCVIRCAGLA